MHPMHPFVSVPHLPPSHPTVPPSRVLLHVWWITWDSQLWLHHRRTRRVHHSRMTLVWRRHRIRGSHDRAQHWNPTPTSALGRVYSILLLWNAAIRHLRRGSTVHPWVIRNHLVRERRRDRSHHRPRRLTGWRRSLLHWYPHRLRMHVWRTMTIRHHPTRNRATLRVHPWSGSGRMARQRWRVRRPITRTVRLLLSRRLPREAVLSFRWRGYGG